MNSEQIINHLIEARLKIGLSQELLGEQAGLGRNVVANIEANRTKLTRSKAIKLAKVLKMSDLELLPLKVDNDIAHKKIVTKNVDNEIIYSLRLHKDQYVPYLDTTNMEEAIIVHSKHDVKNPTGFIFSPEFSDCIAYRTWDDAMAPIIHPGSIIFVRPVTNLKLLKYGRIFYLVVDREPLLRLIHEDTENATQLILYPAKQNYKTLTVSRHEIDFIAEVKGQQTGIFL